MVTTLLGIFLFLLVFLRQCLGKNRRILKRVPGPQGYPFIGNVPEIFYKSPGDLFTIVRTFSTKYSIYRLTLGHVDIINLVNPEDIEQVLTGYQHLSKSKLYSYFNSWLGTGLLTSTGEKWHHRRKLLTPAFHFMILQQFFVIFKEETQKVYEKIEKAMEEDSVIDIMPVVTQFTLETIGETAMGFKNLDDTFLNIYKNNVLQMGKIVINRVIRPWCDEDFVYRLTSYYKEEKRVAKSLHNFSKTVIERRKQTFLEEGQFSGKRKRLLDILLQAKEEGADIDDDGIREEVDTFMFEGHDTTAAALSLILMLLANNPEHQEKAVAEILEAIGPDSDLAYPDTQKFPYLERCIKEGLRLYPSVPMISRTAGCDYVTSTGYRIPAGTTLHLHIFDLHRKPYIYPDPDLFDPDRFLKENCSLRHPFAYIPFSAGPRNCIGQKFAMLELKTFLVGIMRKFRMEAVTKQNDFELETDFVLKTSHPIKIRFIKR
uniref:uncharacterized protein LOC123680936 n=1 Tax=Harmonia axyridis TaxID=115357 RepID=UPI003B512026